MSQIATVQPTLIYLVISTKYHNRQWETVR